MNSEYEENKPSNTRVISLVMIFCLNLAASFFMVYHNQLLLDDLLCITAIDIICFMFLVIALYRKRITGRIASGASTNYRKLVVIIAICWILTMLSMVLPDFYAPVILIVFLLSTTCDDILTLTLALSMNIMYCITCGVSSYMIICYSLMILCSTLLLAFCDSSAHFIEILIMLFSLQIVFPVIFYYFSYLEMNRWVFLYGMIEGFVLCIYLLWIHPKLKKRISVEEEQKYNEIISEDYTLVVDIRRFSLAEYHHALRVSRLSYMCAAEIGVHKQTAACGGFYYRLGKMEGEPEIDNAIRLAVNHCFPRDVIEIMKEYNGILRLPQTPESAIVHMVDALVTKIELLDSDTMSSSWNQDMVIYQTLNELSQKGIYDDSGLTMNQFLKVRECLVKEDSIL